MLLCQKIKENVNTGRHCVVVQHVVSENNFLSLICPLIFHFLSVVLHTISLCHSWFCQYTVLSPSLSVVLLLCHSVSHTAPSKCQFALSLSALLSGFSLPSITLMNSDGGSRVMAGVVSVNASSPFWQIAPINLIYHYFPSSFNKFLWAFPPLMTRCLRWGLAALWHPTAWLAIIQVLRLQITCSYEHIIVFP